MGEPNGETEDTKRTFADTPTVIQGAQGASQLELEILNAAVSSGMITSPQAQQIREAFESAMTLQGIGSGVGDVSDVAVTSGTAENKVSASELTVSLMVEKGLISEDAGQDLRDKVEGEFLPGYRLEGELGRGAMGVVYKAVQKKLDRRVALKVINPALSNDSSYVKRFKLEALALAKLNHPNIVQVYDYGEAEGKIFLALEFVEGQDCSQFMKAEGGVLSEERALRIIREAALGLSHAHQHGIIHRDIKPANLLISHIAQDATAKEWLTKVTDLGLARETERKEGQAELTQAGSILGSPAYMAPEQTTGRPADHRSDIYALGASLYHMLTGKLPFSSKSIVDVLVKKRTEVLDAPRELVPGLSDQLVMVLDRMMAKPADERYQTYADLLADLDAVIAGQEPNTPPVPAEFTSLRPAGKGVKPSPKSKPNPAASVHAKPAPATEPESSARGAVFVLLVLVALAAIGAWSVSKKRQTNTGGTASGNPTGGNPTGGTGGTNGTGAGTSGGRTPVTARAALEGSLTTLEGLDGDGLLAQGKDLDAIKADIAKLPAADARALRLRFSGLLNKVVSARSEALQERLSGLYSAGAYADLAKAVAETRWIYGLLESELPSDLDQFATKSDAAAVDGAGEKERARWAEIEAASDPLELLKLSEGFEAEFPFSPVVAKVAELRAQAESNAPLLELKVVPNKATVTVDGKAQTSGWSGRLPRGPHDVTVRAEGFLTLEQRVELDADLARTLHLGPTPRGLRQAPDVQLPLWRGAAKFPVDFRQQGHWRPRTDQAGLEGEVTDGKPAVVSRDLSKTLRKGVIRSAPGWSLDWEQVPNPSSAGEPEGSPKELAKVSVTARLWTGKQALVLGFEDGELYAGVLGEELAVRYRRKGAFPRHCRLDWDGTVVSFWAEDELLWTARPDETSFERVEFSVERGRALFREMLVIRLQEGE